jgi:glycosyltransferase involved in cell wall biosynthesis
LSDTKYTGDIPQEAYNKIVCAIWSIPNLSSHFSEIINPKPGITWCSAGEDLNQFLQDKYGLNSHPVIGGVSSKHFFPTDDIINIKRVGLNGTPFINSGWDDIKRPQMLVDIANLIGGEAVFINGKSLDEGYKMYKDIDMYICTSTNDRGPYGIIEAAFCKIPVISTKTGIALNSKTIKTFETAEEAALIITELNSDRDKLKQYINDVYTEMTETYNWKAVTEKYWIPIFNKFKK